jgi:hypothetical protein
MRKTYRERAIEKARQEAADTGAEYKAAQFLQIWIYTGVALGAIFTLLNAFAGFPKLWGWLAKGESLDYFIVFQLAILPFAVLMLIWAFQMGKSYVLFGQENTSHAQRRLEALQRNHGGRSKGGS